MRTPNDVLRSLQKHAGQVLGPDWEVRFAVEDGTFKRPFCRVGFAGPTALTGPKHNFQSQAPFTMHLFPNQVPNDTAETMMMRALAVEDVLTLAFRLGGGMLLDPLTAPLLSDDLGALADDDYSYRYAALARDGETLASPAALFSLVGPGGVRLDWEPVPGASGYRVYRDTPDGYRLAAYTREPHWVDSGLTTLHPVSGPKTANDSKVAGPLRLPLYDYGDAPLDGPVAPVRGYADFMRVQDVTVGRAVDPEDERNVVVVVELRMSWMRQGERLDLTGPTLREVRFRAA